MWPVKLEFTLGPLALGSNVPGARAARRALCDIRFPDGHRTASAKHNERRIVSYDNRTFAVCVAKRILVSIAVPVDSIRGVESTLHRHRVRLQVPPQAGQVPPVPVVVRPGQLHPGGEEEALVVLAGEAQVRHDGLAGEGVGDGLLADLAVGALEGGILAMPVCAYNHVVDQRHKRA